MVLSYTRPILAKGNEGFVIHQATHRVDPLEPRRLLAAELFSDLNAVGIDPQDLYAVGDRVVFTAELEPFGRALWASDGTAPGTKMIKDFTPGDDDTFIKENDALTHRSFVYFIVTGIPGADAVYRTDGTAKGTIRLYQNAEGSGAQDLVIFGDQVYFAVDNEVWKTDGSVAGTTLVSSDAQPVSLLGRTESHLYYAVRSASSFDLTLFRTDGSFDEAVEYPGLEGILDGGVPRERFTFTDDAAFFYNGGFPSDGASPLFKSRGDEGMVEIGAFAGADDFTPAGSTLYFTTPDYDETPGKLWRYTDGKFDVLLNSEDNDTSIENLTAVGDSVLAVRNFDQLWLANSVSDAAVLLHDAEPQRPPGGESFDAGRQTIRGVTPAGVDTAFFHVGNDLWTADITAAEVKRIGATPVASPVDFASIFGRAGAFGGGKLFSADNDSTGQIELSVYDGQSAPRIVKDFAGGREDSAPIGLHVANETMYFLTRGEVHRASFPSYGPTEGLFLWKTDGNSAPQHVRSFQASSFSSDPQIFSQGENVYIAIASQLWRTNGTAKGTKRIARGLSAVTPFGATNDRTFFFSNRGNTIEIWATDGKSEGTILLRTFTNAFDSPKVEDPVHFQGRLFFTVNGNLWSSNGTPAGTRRLDALFALSPQRPTSARKLAVFNDRLFFSAFLTATEYALWQTDGTAAGTGLVKDFSEERERGFISGIGVIGRSLYLAASSSVENGFTIYRSDGTARGTSTFYEDFEGFQCEFIPATNGFYIVNGGSGSGNLYFSNGTTSGTSPVSNATGARRAFETALLGERLYFRNDLHTIYSAKDAFAEAVLDEPRPGSDGIQNLTAFNGELFFTAFDREHGTELWHRKPGGTIKGTVFADADRDGVQSPGEGGLPGFRVFLDADDDGRFDSGEQFLRTTRTGRFEFFDLDPGRYQLRMTIVDDLDFTTAASFTLNMRDATTALIRRFGAA